MMANDALSELAVNLQRLRQSSQSANQAIEIRAFYDKMTKKMRSAGTLTLRCGRADGDKSIE